MKNRAQIFSGEFLLAYFVFMTVLVIALLMWYNTIKNLNDSESALFLEEKSVNAAEQLIKTGGVPENWSAYNVKSVGLVNESRILSPEKLARFVELMSDSRFDGLCPNASISNYECKKYLLGLEMLDFYFNVSYGNGSFVWAQGSKAEAGRAPVNQTRLVTVERNALLGGEIVEVTLVVWNARGGELM